MEGDRTASASPPSDSTIATRGQGRPAVFGWYRESSDDARRAWIAASLGWMLDMFDVSLYGLVLASLMLDLGMSTSVGGLLGSVTLIAASVGGILFGVGADRYGRKRAMMASILLYSVATGASGFAVTILQLGVFRIFVGLGMGGEWATGASLVAESFSTQHRQKALAFMQSFAALGLMTAPLVAAVVIPTWGWRGVFFVGVTPALLVLWIRRGVKESEMWTQQRATHADSHSRFGDLFRGHLLFPTIFATLMLAATNFAFWGFTLWLPAYLTLPIEQGGLGLSVGVMGGLLFAQYVGQGFGYIVFGFASDRFGRKSTSIVFILAAAMFLSLYILVGRAANTVVLLVLGPLVTFFGSGHLAGFAAATAELYPTRIRASAQGFTYNVGRLVSAIAPFTVGALAETHGLRIALWITALAYVVSAALWTGIPETKGRVLE